MTTQLTEIRDYRSALAFLFGRIDYERTRSVPYRSRRFKLDRMRQLASRLGNPEQAYPAVHIAGTKGKGSTATMIAAVLVAAGHRTGLYTSPHLHRLEERFVVDGQCCSEEEIVELLALIQPAVVEMDAEAAARGEHSGPTYFEITTAAALLHFQRRNVDLAVLEVGLGGRLDSTNICHPAVSVVTSISFDHTRQLGKTLAAIAGEKAGIIRARVPVITGVTDAEPFNVIRQIAAGHDTRCIALGKDFRFRYLRDLRSTVPPTEGPCGANHGLDYYDTTEARQYVMRGVAVGLLGRHQVTNAAVAIAAIRELQRNGWDIDEAATRAGIVRARCPARIEVLSGPPTIVLDAAHNRASVAALGATLAERFHAQPKILVFATSLDKDARGMLDLLLPQFDQVILTRYLNNPRALDPAELFKLGQTVKTSHNLSRLQLHVRTEPKEAWQLACSLATPAHLICVAGSFFIAAEVRECIDSGT